ncbi:sugar ABC transporter substrate-binding protein [Cellulosimicrobium sp. PMB13]|uniref:sugar ABC transporter substrate-binding protein n=1 Tax=Cellulosimicrobium sp. PMB13 TaxID=3120158 RepID=UPI003F4BE502
MQRRSTVAVTGTLLLALGLTACGGSDGGGDADSSADSGSGDYTGETLTVWIMEGTNPDADAFFDEVTTAFKEETGADLQIEFQPWASAHDKFTTSIAGGTTPDVAEVGTTWTGEFAEVGALTDLTDKISEAGLEEDLVPGLVESATLDGGIYGMPWYAGVRSIVYRTDLFEAAGIEPPTSWDELVAAADALKAANPEIIPFPVAGDSQYGAMPFIWGAGGDLATQDGDTWTSEISSPESVEGLEFYTGLATEHGFSTAAATTWKETDLLAAFEQGQVGMMISGSWTPGKIVADVPDMEGKIGAFPIPGQTDGLSDSFLGGSHLGVFAESDKQDLAWEFVEMMTTGELAEEWGQQSGYFPGQTSLLEKVIEEDDPLVAPFAEQMVEAGRSVPVTPLYGQIQGKKTLETMLQSILSGSASVQEAADTAAADMDETFGS